MSDLTLHGVGVDDTFAEAFPMRATRLIITADSQAWANTAAVTMTGFATSVIACKVEAGIEASLREDESPDGRARRCRADICHGHQNPAAASKRPRRAMRAYQSRLGMFLGPWKATPC